MNMKFPDSTYFNRKLPKQRFYENLTVSAATKKSFVDQIKSIYWENKISADTINIAAENTISVIDNRCALAFEKFVQLQISLCVNGVS